LCNRTCALGLTAMVSLCGCCCITLSCKQEVLQQ
jgi:hypothetical protein